MTLSFQALDDPGLIQLLHTGKVGVLPTETLYGLVCRAADESAVSRLYGLKQRENKPGTVVAASLGQLVELGLKLRYLRAVDQFWENGLSIVIPSATALAHIHLGKMSVACRVVDAPEQLVRLLETCGPLLTTSANKPGKKSANTIAEARQYFGDDVDFYVDGGDLSSHKPSTLIRVVDDAVEVLREGAVIIDEETGRISS